MREQISQAKAALEKAVAENNKDLQSTLRDAMRAGQNLKNPTK
jgi:hypothetical protein